MDLKQYIAEVQDFPKEGINFKDITPLLANPDALRTVVAQMADTCLVNKVDVIVVPESRGFIFGLPVAYALGKPAVLVRKKGKLPRQVIQSYYELEYGTDVLEMHLDSIKPGQRVAIIDDLLATGGTVEAIIRMVKHLGGEVVLVNTLIELVDLNGKNKFDCKAESIIKY